MNYKKRFIFTDAIAILIFIMAIFFLVDSIRNLNLMSPSIIIMVIIPLLLSVGIFYRKNLARRMTIWYFWILAILAILASFLKSVEPATLLSDFILISIVIIMTIFLASKNVKKEFI